MRYSWSFYPKTTTLFLRFLLLLELYYLFHFMQRRVHQFRSSGWEISKNAKFVSSKRMTGDTFLSNYKIRLRFSSLHFFVMLSLQGNCNNNAKSVKWSALCLLKMYHFRSIEYRRVSCHLVLSIFCVTVAQTLEWKYWHLLFIALNFADIFPLENLFVRIFFSFSSFFMF